MNTNVSDMPIEIFGDYVSETLEEEWSWEYLVVAVNDNGRMWANRGEGHYSGKERLFGDGISNKNSGNGNWCNTGDGNNHSQQG